jgi:phosphoglycolate phosphatase
MASADTAGLLKTTILFDLDGTLTDPWPGISRCVRYALDQMDLPHPPETDLRGWIGPPLQHSFSNWLAETGGGDAALALSLYRERFSRTGLLENTVYQGVVALLDELFCAGHRLLLATSKPRIYACRIVEHFGLDRFLAGIYGSELDGSRADKIELLAYIINQEQLHPADCLMLGDREYDMRAARYHGMRAVGALWGFGSSSELYESGAQWLISSPGELTSVLQESAS